MLIECPECRGQISDQAHACPHCGLPSTERGLSEDVSAAKVPESSPRGGKASSVALGIAFTLALVLAMGMSAFRFVIHGPYASTVGATSWHGYDFVIDLLLSPLWWIAGGIAVSRRFAGTRVLLRIFLTAYLGLLGFFTVVGVAQTRSAVTASTAVSLDQRALSDIELADATDEGFALMDLATAKAESDGLGAAGTGAAFDSVAAHWREVANRLSGYREPIEGDLRTTASEMSNSATWMSSAAYNLQNRPDDREARDDFASAYEDYGRRAEQWLAALEAITADSGP